MKRLSTSVTAIALLGVVLVSLAGAMPHDPAALEDLRGFAAATAPNGNIWLVWAADDGHDSDLYYSRWNGQDWSYPRSVYANRNAWDSVPSLTFSADGTAWLAWTAADRETSWILISRWVGYRWSEPEMLPMGRATQADEPSLSAAPDGTMWLAWVGFDGTDDEIFASHWDGTAWAYPQQVSTDDDDRALYDRQPRLAVGKDGRPWLVWIGHQAGVDSEIQASYWNGVAWTPEQMVSQDDDALDTLPSLALDAKGQPSVAWEGQVFEGEQWQLRVLVSRWDAAQSAWTEETIASSPFAAKVHEERPVLSFDSKGKAHLAWIATSDGESGLAYTQQTDSQWSEPLLIRAVADAFAVDMAFAGDDSPQLLWPNLRAGDLLPVASAPVRDSATPLSAWLEGRVPPKQIMGVDPISNRFLAFGDSITWGQYPVDHPTQPPFYPYPSTLEDTLDVRVMSSEVINSGVPGEATGRGKDRIKTEVSTYLPQYVMIMEGTNNVSHSADPADVYVDYLIMLDNAKKHAGVDHVKVMMATLIPRLDNKNDNTEDMNIQAVIPAAAAKNVPVCDQWQAFYNYVSQHGIPLGAIYWDEKHPDQEGLDLFAATWYNCLLANYSWLNEEGVPPDAWIVSGTPPPQTPCGGQVNVSWTGSDNLTPVQDLEYDVQMSVNGGPFTDWIMDTQTTSSSFVHETYNDTFGFQVRARDIVGNQGVYSTPAYTVISDGVPPLGYIDELPSFRFAPFTVSWGGSDDCSGVGTYNVQYKVGIAGTWTDWKMGTTDTSGSFTPLPAQYGETYYFHAGVYDQAGNWSGWYETSTVLAQYSLAGHIYNVRHQPVAAAQTLVSPDPLWLGAQPAGFLAYIATESDYDVTTARDDLYGTLPTMLDVTVDQNITGLEFVLPPSDDAVADGDFEAGDLAAWQTGGTAPPTVTVLAHTGSGAVRLDGSLSDARLSQTIIPALSISDPTLSFLVRLAAEGPPSVLHIELANSGTLSPPVTYALAVEDVGWTHAWYDLSGLVSEPLTLTLVVSDDAAVILDEIRLGSALADGHWYYLPFILR